MFKPDVLSAEEALSQVQGKVLLVNPPVIDSRYPWVKWNQPLDLLKLGTLFRKEYGCEVKLFDFLLPTSAGSVPRQQASIDVDLPLGEPIRWHFGQSFAVFDDFLDKLISRKWKPNSVWITTLTSFWWQTVPLVANLVKNKLKGPSVFLYGNYPYLETEHAARFCPNIDVVVRSHADLTCFCADFSLYEDRKLRFCALDIRSPDPVSEIAHALERGTAHFAFFNDNLFEDFDARLKPILKEVLRKNWDIWFHGICGVETEHFPIENARLLADAHFTELHFEPAMYADGILNESLFREVMQACEEAGICFRRGGGWQSTSHFLSGFLWIGRPDDVIDTLVWNTLKLLQLVGMVIPKPFSPIHATDDFSRLSSQIGYLEPDDISPHRLPFAGLNGLTRGDYEELYRLSAFLNMKVRHRTFDFLGDTYLAQIVREALAGRRWDI